MIAFVSTTKKFLFQLKIKNTDKDASVDNLIHLFNVTKEALIVSSISYQL